MARGVNHPVTRLAWVVLTHVLLLATVAGTAAAAPGEQATRPPPAPMTIVDLQAFRTEMRVPVQRADNVAGDATLTNLNPHVNAWFLLALDWGATRPREVYHLENARTERALALRAGPRGFVEIDFGDRSPPCTLPLAGADGSAGRARPGARIGAPVRADLRWAPLRPQPDRRPGQLIGEGHGLSARQRLGR